MQHAARRQKSIVNSVPAPTGGWNARDPLAAMAREDAVQLINWMPRVADCTMRGGKIDWATGFVSRPSTLSVYTSPTGANKFWACTSAGIFDISAGGAIGAAANTITNGYFVWLQMGVSGGHYLMMFNGVDKPRYYDGTNWISIDAASTPAITGVTTTNLVSANSFKRRLYLIENGKLSFWYLPSDQVGGAAVEFLLGPLCIRGGYLMAMGTWTVDSGSGPDDYAVFVTSQGEIIVYAGTNPGSSVDWALVGVYRVDAKPIGRRCLQKFGGDLIVITQLGVLPLAKLLQSSAINYRVALTDKIDKAFILAAQAAQATLGWESVLFPIQNALLFNIPTSTSGVYEQYVMNTITKSWGRFQGWDASAWAVFGNDLYFADATTVQRAWAGHADNGANITAYGQTAFNYFGKFSQAKRWTLMRPLLLVDSPLGFSIGLVVDFDTPGDLTLATTTTAAGAVWDVDLWDVGLWTGSLVAQRNWQTPAAIVGYAASGLLQVVTNAVDVQWTASDYVYEEGGILG